MGSSQSGPRASPREHILIVGGTGRTGRRLVELLCANPQFEVTVLARDPKKAERLFGKCTVNVIKGDLRDVAAWETHLVGVSQIFTAVSCGIFTFSPFGVDPLVLMGFRTEPESLPQCTDGEGIAQLAAAGKKYGVRRMVTVTTASSGTPWSAAAVFLNTFHYSSVKWKWMGEQAIRRSGMDYIILRPFGLGADVPSPPGDRGVDWSQGKSPGATRRHIPRDDLARLCYEALSLEGTVGSRATFECWSTDSHLRPMGWTLLRPDPPGALPEVHHDLPVAAALGTSAVLGAGLLRGSWGAGRGMVRMLARR